MKRKQLLRILPVLLLLLAVGCGPTPSSPAESPTQALTYTATRDELNEILARTEEKVPLIGAWVTPRQGNCKTQEASDAQYALYAAAGMNMVITDWETQSSRVFQRFAESCRKNNLKIMLSLKRIPTEGSLDSNLKMVEKFGDYPEIIGYHLYDEPNSSVFPVLSEEYAAVREAVGPDKLITVNLFPNYASDEQLGAYPGNGKTAYQNYLSEFFARADSDVLSFDYYPMMESPDATEYRFAGMLRQFCDVADAADAAGKPRWGFVQCASWNGTRQPTEAELRFLTHYHMMFGLSGYSYFLYSSPIKGETNEGTFRGIVNWDGTPTEMYGSVQKTCRELLGMKGQYLNYHFQGLFLRNEKERIACELPANRNMDTEENKEKSGIRDLLTEGVFYCGSFENENWRGLYPVNGDTTDNGSLTVDFGTIVEYRIWDSTGLAAAGTAEKLTLDFIPGEGKFIEFQPVKVFG